MITSLDDRKFLGKHSAKRYCLSPFLPDWGFCNRHPYFTLEFCAKYNATRCYYLSSISVPHQHQLRKVRVNYDGMYLQAIEIKARNLIEFRLFASSKSLEVDLRACAELQILEFDCQYIPNQFPHDSSLELPHLKSLSLPSCKKLKKIKLLSSELEYLFLSDMLDLDDAVIDTPNLHSFKLMNMEKVPSRFPIVGPRLMEVEIGFKNALTTNNFVEMKTFARNLGENITLSFDTTELKEVISHSKNLQSNYIEPLCIKHITLEVLSLVIPGYEFFIHELFTYFHPRTLLVRGDSERIKKEAIGMVLESIYNLQ